MVPEFGDRDMRPKEYPGAERYVGRASSLAPKDEWNALVKLNRLATGLAWWLGMWLLTPVVVASWVATGASSIGRDLRDAEPVTRAAVIGAYVGVGIALYIGRRLALRAIHLRLSALEMRGYDVGRLGRAARIEVNLEPVRAAQREEERWTAERAAVPPWWRTELSGGQLLLNLYIIAGALVAAVPSLHETRWAAFGALACLAVFFKLIVPGIFAAFMLVSSDRQQGLRDSWRYYRWWAHSKFAFILALGVGILTALAASGTPPG
jgi:hypothetical protein